MAKRRLPVRRTFLAALGTAFLLASWRPAPLQQQAGTVLTLGEGGRYQVTATFRDFDGHTGTATPVAGTPSRDAGLFSFFRPDNWELLIKVLDGCPVNQRVWVYLAATTNVEFTVTVRDTVTGRTKSYTNPLGRLAPAITDSAALDVCGSSAVTETPTPRAHKDQPLNLYLRGGRFALTVDWRTHAGVTGVARAELFRSNDSGLLYFFRPDNWEMLVKVLDGCPVNGHYWLFAAAATDVAFELSLVDRETTAVRRYSKSDFAPAPVLADITALPCPGNTSSTSSTVPGSTTIPTTTVSTTIATSTIVSTTVPPTTIPTTTTVATSTSTSSAGSSSTTTSITSSSTTSSAASTSSSSTTSVATTTSTSTTTSVPAGVSFQNQVMPLFTTWGCTACHTSTHDCDGSGATSGYLDYTAACAVVHQQLTAPVAAQTQGCTAGQRVNTGSPANSLLLLKPTTGTSGIGHGGGNIWNPDNDCSTAGTAEQQAYCTVLQWIQQGAADDC